MSTMTKQPSAHGDRLHRTLLLLLGLLLLAAGVATLLAGWGVFGSGFRDEAVFDNAVGRYIGRHGSWLWPVIAAVLVVIGLLALRWLLTLVATPRLGTVDATTDREAGRTTITGGAVTDAVAREAGGLRGVRSASARLTGSSHDPTLWVTVAVAEDADLPAVRTRLLAEVVDHARSALARPQMPVHLRLDVDRHRTSRSIA